MIRKLDLFPSSSEGRETSALLRPFERTNLNHWIRNTYLTPRRRVILEKTTSRSLQEFYKTLRTAKMPVIIRRMNSLHSTHLTAVTFLLILSSHLHLVCPSLVLPTTQHIPVSSHACYMPRSPPPFTILHTFSRE
jgi:hypothetical protein